MHDFTDHLPTFIRVPILVPQDQSQKVKIRFRKYDDDSRRRFEQLLEDCDWEDCNQINFAISIFKLKKSFDLCIKH